MTTPHVFVVPGQILRRLKYLDLLFILYGVLLFIIIIIIIIIILANECLELFESLTPFSWIS